MASPQLENGYTPIAHEIIEALWKINLSAYESRVVWYLLRKTYGWNKKTDRIALSQFSKDIGIDRRLVHRAIHSLSSKKMIVIYKDDSMSVSYGFQKNYEKWKVSSKKMTVIYGDDKPSSKEMTKLSSKEIPTIYIKNKETIKGSKKTDPRIKIFIDWWYRLYEYKFNEKYAIPNGGKIGEQVKNILKTNISFRDIQLKAMLFMADKDPFLVGSEEKAGAGYDIGIFLTRMNKYSANTIRNNENFTKWLINEQGERVN
jgi:phage replication O-like protein O